jgi:hypothetical protein
LARGGSMNVPILVCGCGMRIKAPGAKPGRVGRCPGCGGRLEFPAAPIIEEEPGPPMIQVGPEPAIGLAGAPKGFGAVREIALNPPRTSPRVSKSKRARSQGGPAAPVCRSPMSDGLLPLQQEPESSWLTSFLYPLRGAESMGMLAAIGVLAWALTVLVPEYCLQAMADTEAMGASLLGLFFVWIAVLPTFFLGPLVLAFWLQYLGRILVSSAMGECAPPRSPDRNFDGFLHGLSPWLIWLVLGLGVGLIPAMLWAFPGGRFTGDLPWQSLALAAVALPYILAALMLSFLHDDAMAAMPWGVLLGLVRLGLSFLILSGLIASALGLVAECFVLALTIRAHAFWPYLPIALVCWILFLWCQMAIVRLLGLHYFRHKDSLRWHRAHPRWGVAWRL